MNNKNIINGIMEIVNEDSSVTFIPEDGCTQDEKKLFDEFREEYPNGKPFPEPPVVNLTPSDSERISALEDAVSILMGV